jgi:hypothetical protein
MFYRFSGSTRKPASNYRGGLFVVSYAGNISSFVDHPEMQSQKGDILPFSVK